LAFLPLSAVTSFNTIHYPYSIDRNVFDEQTRGVRVSHTPEENRIWKSLEELVTSWITTIPTAANAANPESTKGQHNIN